MTQLPPSAPADRPVVRLLRVVLVPVRLGLEHRWLLLTAGVALLGVLLLTWNLASAPAGPTIDELSIGQNAWHLAETGRDEHGRRFPLYFEAFSWGTVGEYKNPVYIYLLVPFEMAFGPGDAVLRIPAVLLTLLLSACLGLCLLELAAQGLIDAPPARARVLALLVALASLTTPWCFHFGRLALEGISYPAFLALALYLTLRLRRTAYPLLGLGAGLVWGLTVYTYSTARLVVPLLLVALLLTHLGWIRRQPRAAAALVLGCAVAVVPLAIFMHAHPGELTRKFLGSTLCPRPTPTLEALRQCLAEPPTRALLEERYLEYLGLGFLFRSGDPNLLHGAPGHGLLHLYWLPLAALGLAWMVRQRRVALAWFLGLALLVAPVAAALMREPLHAIRSMAALPFLLLLGGIGLAEAVALTAGASPALRRAAMLGLGIVALLETRGYLHDYHTRYRRALYHQQPHVALAEAIRVAAAARAPSGHLYLPAEMVRNPITGQSRLEGHVSVFWRYYLRVKGPWSRPNGHQVGLRGGLPPAEAPRGSVAIVPARPRGPHPCPDLPGGFALIRVVRTPAPQPVPKLCVFARR